MFSRILDARKGGYWQITPDVPSEVNQTYRDRTNLLDTIFATDMGLVTVTDFMPADAHDIMQHARLHDEPRLIRIVECLAGRVTMRHIFDPKPRFGLEESRFVCDDEHHIHADAGDLHLCLSSTVDLGGTDTTFTLSTGESAALSLRASKRGRCQTESWTVERARAYFRRSREFWWQWVGRVAYDGPYQVHVWRSALALKLMTYAPTGAIVAAPTTSLPEAIGGDRNWDYRFTWLRDASFTLYAFFQLDLVEEAEAFFHWLTHRHLAQRRRRVPNLFDLSGHVHPTETELTHLEGYRKSRPVRIGNAATTQLQLDVYGEVLDSAYIYARFGGRISKALWEELRHIVDLAIDEWQKPDSSIWEARSEEQPYTYSKLMCWVAVDRGLRIAERYRHAHDATGWRAARRAIHRRITQQAWSQRRQAFAQFLGGDTLDAAVLRMSQARFLSDRDPRLINTINAIDEHLGAGVLVRRYRTDESADGLEGSEGAFFMTSFWLVDAIAHIGDVERAARRFEQLLTFASPVGLFSEEVDPGSGALLGNYPQAFTHLALVGAAVNIERARHRTLGVRGLE